MPEMFSWTDSFNESYFLKTLVKTFIACLTIKNNPKATIGTSPTKMKPINPPPTKVITAEKISIKGALTTIRIIIWKAFCTLLISVVILVTKDEAENLSIFWKEKLVNFLYKSLLRLVAKPTEAIEANLPPHIPHNKETIAIANKIKAR